MLYYFGYFKQASYGRDTFMSGHSKWHNIQAKKGKTDAARGKIFTKIGR